MLAKESNWMRVNCSPSSRSLEEEELDALLAPFNVAAKLTGPGAAGAGRDEFPFQVAILSMLQNVSCTCVVRDGAALSAREQWRVTGRRAAFFALRSLRCSCCREVRRCTASLWRPLRRASVMRQLAPL